MTEFENEMLQRLLTMKADELKSDNRKVVTELVANIEDIRSKLIALEVCKSF